MSLKHILIAGLLILITIGIGTATTETLLSDGFDNGLSNFSQFGNVTVSNGKATIGNNGTIYIQYNHNELSYPNKTISFNWTTPDTISYQNLSFKNIFSLKEGVWNDFDKSIMMFYNGTHVYFELQTYVDTVNTSSDSSQNYSVLPATDYYIVITSTADNTTISFNNNIYSNSTVFTNVFNTLEFSSFSPQNTVLDDDNSKEKNTAYINGNTTRYRKNITLSDINNITSANVTMLLDKDATITGGIVVNINGYDELNLTESLVSPGTANPIYTWYTFSINTSHLISGNNSIILYGSGTTTTVLHIDNTTTSHNNSSKSIDSGATWNFTNIGSTAGITGEYMIRLQLDQSINYSVDNILIQQDNQSNLSDLYGRVYDQMIYTFPTDVNKIYAIYPYLLTRNNSYLVVAESGADIIQSAYDSGNKNLFYVKEVALLSKYNSSRTPLLDNLTELLWTYKVNQTTNLSYYVIGTNGVPTNSLAMIVGSRDVLETSNAFIYSYKTTGNLTSLQRGESIFDAVNTYMKHSVYDTIITSVNATNGTQEGANTNGSRGGDQIANFIDNSLYLYEITGNQTYLTWAIYQADTWSALAWDNTTGGFYYRPDDTGYENFVPSMSEALLHLYKYTNNQTYLDRATLNYMLYSTQIKRNGVGIHYFYNNGRYGHGVSYPIYAASTTAALLYRYTQNNTYLDISDEYTQRLLTNNFERNIDTLLDNNYTKDTDLTYQRRQTNIIQFIYRFILPSSGVNISWDNGSDIYQRLYDVVNAPTDIYFTRNGVTLLNVSGNGNIDFYKDITSVNITSQNGSSIGLKMLNNNKLYVLPNSSRIFNITVLTWNPTGDYYKKWTESSTNASTTTQHIIGDFPINTNIQIKRDGVNYAQLTSNASGYINWTYSGGYSEHQFEIYIAPVLDSIGNKTVAEASLLSFTLNATCVGCNLTYSKDSSKGTLNSTSGLFTWTPDYSESGIYPIIFTVNNSGITDNETVYITVIDTPSGGGGGGSSVVTIINRSTPVHTPEIQYNESFTSMTTYQSNDPIRLGVYSINVTPSCPYPIQIYRSGDRVQISNMCIFSNITVDFISPKQSQIYLLTPTPVLIPQEIKYVTPDNQYYIIRTHPPTLGTFIIADPNTTNTIQLTPEYIKLKAQEFLIKLQSIDISQIQYQLSQIPSRIRSIDLYSTIQALINSISSRVNELRLSI
ncbi:MAG: hypothetical protein WC623_22370 [Pedobacter sp.]|uniref:Ig domain-containing protein n=1 Tax=Pedobacter sp. TaxID=1411316 RepID=UPI003567111A